MRTYTYTSESVGKGHPDKLCDQISDSILDAHLNHDPHARAGIEALATKGHVILAGEVKSAHHFSLEDYQKIARTCIREIGYTGPNFGWDSVAIQCYIHRQSPDISQGVDANTEGQEGAGDQGSMFGYASSETPSLMPAPLYYSHLMMHHLYLDHPDLGPDGKCQFSIDYQDDVPVGASAIVVSIQHPESLSHEAVKDRVKKTLKKIIPESWAFKDNRLYVNSTGRFVIGGPEADTGLTGRKIIVDTYGGMVPHGGGAFSGKDASKVDRSAAYAMRYLAKNIVAAGLAQRCLLQVSYAIGRADPTSLYLNTFGTATCDEEKLLSLLPNLMDLRPVGIKKHLNLLRPIYKATASNGHFGKTPGPDGTFSWEKIDLVNDLKSALL